MAILTVRNVPEDVHRALRGGNLVPVECHAGRAAGTVQGSRILPFDTGAARNTSLFDTAGVKVIKLWKGA